MALVQVLRLPARLTHISVSARPGQTLRAHRAASTIPAWATCDPQAMTPSHPAEGKCLLNGDWMTGKKSREVVDPLTGELMARVPELGFDEIDPFVERMVSVPRTGLHNPMKNPERYVMLGEVCARAASEMRKPEVEKFFTQLIQRLTPKSNAQAGGEPRVVRKWLETYSCDNVRYLAKSFGVPGDHAGQTSTGMRMPFGGVGVITPFNFPLEIPAIQTMSALFMGNMPTTHVDWKVQLCMEQWVRMLHHCGLPTTDINLIYTLGPVMNEVLVRGNARMLLFTGSQRVAEKLCLDLKGKVKLEDAGFDWKILGPDPSEVEFVAYQSDQDAYGFSGQKCSAQSMLFVHENWDTPEIDIVRRLKDKAEQRNLGNLTIGPIFSWTTEQMMVHIRSCLTIPGATLAFGGKALEGHTIPEQYGAIQPTAVRVPIASLREQKYFDIATTELFGPFQIIVDYKDEELPLVMDSINRMQNHLTAGVVSKDMQFLNDVVGNAVTGTIYAGPRARTTGAPQQHWFGPSGDPRAGGIHTKEAIQLCWSSHREVIWDFGRVPDDWKPVQS